MREWYGAFPDWGPLAEDSATKLKRGQLMYVPVLSICTVYTLFSLWLKFVPVGRQFLSVVDSSKVLGICCGLAECLIFHSKLAGRGGGG